METQQGSSAVPDADAPIAHGRMLAIFGGLMLVMALAALDQTIVATALPTIVGDLGGLDKISWIVTAYVLTSAISTPLYGKLGDQFGRKHMVRVAIVMFVGGSALCGLAQTMMQLVMFRAVQGLGAGGLMVVSMAAMADVASPRERSKYAGYFGAIFGGATIAGPLIGGFLTDHVSWPWIFYVNLPLGALAFAIVTVAMPARPRATSSQIDYLGTTVLALAIGAFVLMTTWGGQRFDWLSPAIIGMGLAVVVLTAVFIAIERRSPEPMLPLVVFRDRTVSVACGLGVCQGLAVMGTSAFIPLFLQMVVGISATNSGLNMAPMMVGNTVAAIVAGNVVARTGSYRHYPTVGMGAGCVAVILLSTIGLDTGRWTVMAYMILLGMGMGLIMQVTTLAPQNSVPVSQIGVATSSVAFFRSMGMLLGVSAFGTIFNSRFATELDGLVGGAAGIDPTSLTPAGLRALPPETRLQFREAFASAIPDLFLFAVPILVLAVFLATRLPVKPLVDRVYGASGATDPVADGQPTAAAGVADLALGH